ncbi:unnamed protein product [Porites evermanni]|uniref:Uncharacterized protein n=1 Tax=Porites evermanni TaxID=104178 RepID=A0ABN8SNA6_9CNID|nr:unnamed protein product [Porites evermanni]
MAEFPLARERHQQRDSETNINKFVIITSITLDNYKFLDPPLLREISDVCYKTQRNILLPDDLKKKIYQPSTSADTETMKNKAKPIKEEVRNRNTFRTKALIASLI